MRYSSPGNALSKFEKAAAAFVKVFKWGLVFCLFYQAAICKKYKQARRIPFGRALSGESRGTFFGKKDIYFYKLETSFNYSHYHHYNASFHHSRLESYLK
jgi:hypothetical protein